MKNFSEEEVKILAVKYGSKRIGDMDTDVFSVEAGAVILKIHAITGWKIPPDASHVKILKDEFKLYLTDNHTDMTIDEVLYAVRNYALEIQDWGKSMNLALINQPIARYRARRTELSELEQRVKQQAAKPAEAPQLPMEADWSMVWSDILIAAQENRVENKIIPVPVYDWLVRQAKLILTASQRTEYYNRARDLYKTDLLTRYAIDQLTLEEKQHLQVIKAEKDLETENTKNVIVNRAKVMAVKEFAKQEAAGG